MKVLISVAVWGKAYCSLLTRFSLATLLSPKNIPELAKESSITIHIVTTRRDRRNLSTADIVAELQRYCSIEWEIIDDFGIYQPPTGPGGEKYPFLSGLQNIAIARAADFDAIVFNYADFIWADGSLSAVVEMLKADRSLDAVLGFCLPVDRDSALTLLERYRSTGPLGIIELAPRDASKVVIRCLHREAKNRFWDSLGFTITPSYLMWRIEPYGVLLRAYHQSVLAMRVRPREPGYPQRILRGSLDASLAAQLAQASSVTFATDTDKVLVFSLYDTPVDSRMPSGMTREMSMRKFVAGDVVPKQRRFAEYAYRLKLKDGGEPEWDLIATESWSTLQHLQDTTSFDQAMYDENLRTHGVIPAMVRQSSMRRRIIRPLQVIAFRVGSIPVVARLIGYLRYRIKRAGRICYVLWHPGLIQAAIIRRIQRLSDRRKRLERVLFVMQHPPLMRAALRRRLSRFPKRGLGRFPKWGLGRFASWRLGFHLVPNAWVPRKASCSFAEAIEIEASLGKMPDNAQLAAALRRGEKLLRETIGRAPFWIEAARALGRNLWFQGRFEEAKVTMVGAEQLRDDVARLAHWPVDSCVLLPRNCTQSIGLMGHLDGFAKHKILTADARPYYLLTSADQVVNPAFLDYWRDHISIMSHVDDVERLAPLESCYSVNWNWVVPNEGELTFVHAGLAAIERRWSSENRPPLLNLQPGHAELLTKARAKWGMRDGERFVCLHVRSDGFYSGSAENAQRFRNTAIDSYYPLIRRLTDVGLWVIRMGDGSMTGLDITQCGSTGRVVDYAICLDRCAELDVALCAECELFVSSPSGLHTVAHAFGRPVCEVNYPIYNGFPWHPGDIFIPQLYFSHAKGRVLTLEEILGTDVVHRDHQFLLEQAGISLVPNEPDDIVETVREALAPATYKVKDEALADKVGATFDTLNRKHSVGISGRLGRYFSMKYASQLLPAQSHPQYLIRAKPAPKARKLDLLIPCFNRAAAVHHILKTALAFNIPGAYFVVFDDGSCAFEDVLGLGRVNPEMVCRSFNDERVIYTRNPTNMGVAKSLEYYYRVNCDAEYTSLLNPKDEFISGEPIAEAVAKLDADPKVSFVVYPLRQIDQSETDKPLLFNYARMSGREFIAAHVRDSALQHCSGYAVIRVSALRAASTPRNLDLREFGLEDASGIDHEMIFNLATTGDVDFVNEAPIRRKIVGGYTENYPLTFAYTQYQYARRLMAELEPRGYVSALTRRQYLSFWHLIIARGLVVAYKPVYGTELERGVKRIRPHLQMPILLYLPLECLRWRVMPRMEALKTYMVGARLLLKDWLKKLVGLPHIA